MPSFLSTRSGYNSSEFGDEDVILEEGEHYFDDEDEDEEVHAYDSLNASYVNVKEDAFSSALRALQACTVHNNGQEVASRVDAVLVSFNRDSTATCDEACRTIAQLLRDSSASDAILAEAGCGALQTMAKGNARLQMVLGACGACERVVDALEFFPTNMGVVGQALLALANLSSRNQLNKKRFDDYGACQILIAVLKRPGGLPPMVANAACCAVAQLAQGEDKIAAKLLNSRAEVLIRLLPDDAATSGGRGLTWRRPALEALKIL